MFRHLKGVRMFTMSSKHEVPRRFTPEKGFIPDRRIVNALIVNEEGRILLLKRPEENRYFGGYYHIISGKLNEGEGFDIGLIREAKEELGCDISACRIIELGDFEYTEWDGETWEMKPFLVFVEEGLDIDLNEEHTECLWIEIEDIEDFPITVQVGEMVERMLDFEE